MSLLKTLREPKLLNMSIFDFVATFVIAIILNKFVLPKQNVFLIFILLVILGIIIHMQFNIPTMMNYYLGINSYEDVMELRRNM